MYIYHLVIEVTRVCNLKCKHCCRGCAKKDCFSSRYLDNVFDGIDQIGILSFTGGEPLLKVRTIINILNYIKKHNIELDAFYMVHNGTIYSKRLMEVLKDFYDNYCWEKGMCGFSLSTDQFHQEEIMKKKLKTYIDKYIDLSYRGFDFVFNDRKEINSLILSGRGKRNKDIIHPKYGYRKAEFLDGFFETDCDYCEGDNLVYVSANGNVISNCDLSYDIVDRYSFGNIKKETLKDIIIRKTKKAELLKRFFV